MIKVLVLSAEQDPLPLSRYLWQAGVRHRILLDEQSGGHALWLLEPNQMPELRTALARWEQGEPVLRQPRPALWSQALKAFNRRPVTLTLMGFAVMVTLAFEKLLGPGVFFLLSFTPMAIQGGQLISLPLTETLSTGQWWRLVTPIFLHFGWMHLVFNLLWVWVLGEVIERQQGHVRLLMIVLVAAVLSNAAQFLINGSSQFGGLSGVVYAYLGYTWLWDRRHPDQALGLPNALVVFMLGWMLLGMLPMSASLGLNMANEAHLGGLLTGLLLALLPRKMQRNG